MRRPGHTGSPFVLQGMLHRPHSPLAGHNDTGASTESRHQLTPIARYGARTHIPLSALDRHLCVRPRSRAIQANRRDNSRTAADRLCSDLDPLSHPHRFRKRPDIRHSAARVDRARRGSGWCCGLVPRDQDRSRTFAGTRRGAPSGRDRRVAWHPSCLVGVVGHQSAADRGSG